MNAIIFTNDSNGIKIYKNLEQAFINMELTLDQALQKGIEAHKAGRVQEADRYYTAILKANPNHPDANHNMGVLAVGLGKIEEALPFFTTAIAINPRIAQYWLSNINTLIKLERIADAKEALNQARKSGAKGDAFDQLEKKLSNYSHINDNQLNGNQSNQEILENAINLRESGNYDEAIEFLKKRISKFPEDPSLPAVLSHCYILNGNLENAIIYLDKAKSINPEIAAVGWNETRLLLKQKNPVEALSVAKKTNASFPNDIEGMVVLGSCFRVNGDFKESLNILNKALELDPNYTEALINRGLIYLNQKDDANALNDLEKAHHLKLHIREIWHIILSLKMKVNDFQNAINLAEKMIDFDPLDEKLFAVIALCNQKLKNYNEAVIFYEKALSVKPDYAEATFNMVAAICDQGRHLKEKGKLNEAIESFEKALSIKPDYADANLYMGYALKEQGKAGQAVEAYNKVISINPNYAEAYYGLAEILYTQDDYTGVMENLVHVNSKVAELDLDKKYLRLPYKILTSVKYKDVRTIRGLKSSKYSENSNKFPLMVERKVEDELINCLYKLNTRSLDETIDARYGSGKCSTDFQLFETDEAIIKKVASELLKSMEKLLDGTVLYHESFFNILGAGGGTKPHDHLREHDLSFDLDKYKYSLVYYLSVGDQNCTEPGTLKLYEPDIDILPTKGMCVLIPASTKHSAIYNGSKDRMMIGCNFYLI